MPLEGLINCESQNSQISLACECCVLVISFSAFLQLFAHLASDALMQPLGHFSNEVTAINYPPIEVGKFVESELDAINLRNTQQPLNGGR